MSNSSVVTCPGGFSHSGDFLVLDSDCPAHVLTLNVLWSMALVSGVLCFFASFRKLLTFAAPQRTSKSHVFVLSSTGVVFALLTVATAALKLTLHQNIGTDPAVSVLCESLPRDAIADV